jgi:hypothetical protein
VALRCCRIVWVRLSTWPRSHRVRIEAKPIEVSYWRTPGVALRCARRPSPAHTAAERGLKALQSLARRRVHHLLMKSWIRFRRIDPATYQYLRVVKIDRRVVSLHRSVVIDDGEALADGTMHQRLARNPHGHLVAEHAPAPGSNAYTLRGRSVGVRPVVAGAEMSDSAASAERAALRVVEVLPADTFRVCRSIEFSAP